MDRNEVSLNSLILSAEVTVILFVEFAVGITVIAAGFGYKHTYIVQETVYNTHNCMDYNFIPHTYV